MVDYLKHFERSIDALKQERRYRVFADLERQVGRFPKAMLHGTEGTKEVTVWCSNDYLGMGQHPDVIEAMSHAARTMGAGAGGTRNISGTHHAIVELETELADLHDKEAALVFTSGYVSNLAGIATIARLLPDCVILSDALNHNSNGAARHGASAHHADAVPRRGTGGTSGGRPSGRLERTGLAVGRAGGRARAPVAHGGRRRLST